jgi:hypothetical protein
MGRASGVSGITEGNAGVAHQATPLCALYWTSAKDGAELFFIQ